MRTTGVFGLALLALASAGCGPAPVPEEPHPGPRWGHAFVYDPLRDNVVLFGGAPRRGEYRGDTWILSATGGEARWRLHDGPGPGARGFAATAFHPERGTVMLHGGRGADGSTLTDTWEWDGASWRSLGASEYRADHHRMVHLPESGSLVAFGGWDGDGVLGSTWSWDGVWTQVDIDGPPPRSAFGLAYDPGRRRAVLHGGLWINGQYADVWEWDGVAWRQVGGPYDNSSVDHNSMSYFPAAGRVLSFGGKNYRYQPLARLSAIREGRVQSLGAAGEGVEAPTPRHSTDLTYDSRRGRLLLYGGKYYRLDEQLALADLWAWDGESWSRLDPAD